MEGIFLEMNTVLVKIRQEKNNAFCCESYDNV